MDTVDTLDQSVERLYELLRNVLGTHSSEVVRRDFYSAYEQLHARKMLAEGRHPRTGETPEEYADSIRRGRGTHPVTGETSEQYDVRVADVGLKGAK